MLNAAITCVKSPSPGWPGGCGQLFLDASDPAGVADAITRALAEHGWSERDGEHFCPVYDPAQAGDVLEIEPGRYRPLGDSGWEARIPPGQRFAEGAVVSIEIRQRLGADPGDAPPDEPEPVSTTDEAAAALDAFLNASPGDASEDGQNLGPDVIVRWPRTEGGIYGNGLTEDDLRGLLAERAAARALAPDSREHEDPFYRPGGVYVSVNGWWRFTCKAVIAGVALGVEECLKERAEPRFTKRNIWRSVRAAGCDYEVDAATSEPLAALTGEEQ